MTERVSYNLSALALDALKDDSRIPAWEEAQRRFKEKAQEYFKLISCGAVISCTVGKNLIIYSRSLRQGVSIQRSTFWYWDGEYIALSHHDIRTEKELSEEMRDGVEYLIEYVA